MKTTSNSKQVALLDKVSQICNAYGVRYNPSNEALQPTALTSLLEQAREKIKAVNVARAAYTLAVTARAESFEGIPKLVASVTQLLAASGVSKDQLDDVKMIKRGFTYEKRKKKVAINSEGGTDPSAEKTTSRHIGRMNMLDKFELLIEMLQSIPAYKPKDPEFQVVQLKARLMELQAYNFAVLQAKTNLTTARMERNKLFDGPNGVAEVIRLAKAYIRGKFGLMSDEFKPTKSV